MLGRNESSCEFLVSRDKIHRREWRQPLGPRRIVHPAPTQWTLSYQEEHRRRRRAKNPTLQMQRERHTQIKSPQIRREGDGENQGLVGTKRKDGSSDSTGGIGNANDRSHVMRYFLSNDDEKRTW
ncbi:hypothetical protein CDAR_622861 [Caerostris darwini]|uniref:Uncharacterized protein n=1 Tax=Caerostris darwini TaxID=1538125 RepID=A0AAV4WKT8_9ARAC|nr:hypothetical protein CDAR_622861 [Caerostris darwini]